MLACSYWSESSELLTAASTTYSPSQPTFIGNVQARAELSPFFLDWMWIISRRLARRMLPQPWLWDGGISYRYDVKSDLFLSVLHYPQMACAVNLDTQRAIWVLSEPKPVEQPWRWLLPHWHLALRNPFLGLQADCVMPFAKLSEAHFSGNSCRQSKECSLLLSQQME